MLRYDIAMCNEGCVISHLGLFTCLLCTYSWCSLSFEFVDLRFLVLYLIFGLGVEGGIYYDLFLSNSFGSFNGLV